MSRPPPLTAIPPEIAAVADYEPLAAARVEPGAWAYFESGAADELTLRSNRAAYDRIRIEPRVLADFSKPGSTSVELFGRTFDCPILLAPIAYHKLAHPDGEVATALGASASGAGLVVSTHASVQIEEIARAARTPLWFQLYVKPDRGLTRDLVRRAEEAGYGALVVTVDAAAPGVRNRQQRALFKLPKGVAAVNLPSDSPMGGLGLAPGTLVAGGLSGSPTWKDMAWLKGTTRMPILLKGILSADDALRAADEGMNGVVVSNHGGRALDTAPATIEALPRIADRVAGRIPLLVDGGIRRGTDVFKALALGASAVMVGRPYLHGLATAGSLGVAHVVRILRGELEVAMALTGRSTLAAIDRSALWRD